MKAIFRKKSVLFRIALSLLLVPVLLALVTFLLSNEIENVLGRQSRILYSGPDDLKAFIAQDNTLYIVSADFDQLQSVSDPQADIALEVYEGNASLFFSPEKISSIIAFERLSELLLQYNQVSTQGEPVEVYYESTEQGRISASEDRQYSLNHTVRFLLAAIASLLAFVILITGHGKIANNKALASLNGKMEVLMQFVPVVSYSFFTSVLLAMSVFVSVNNLIPRLLPVNMAEVIFLSDTRTFFILLLTGFVLQLSSHALKTCFQDFFFIPVFFVPFAIFMNISAFLGTIPEWSFFFPILNLHGILLDVIINGVETIRLVGAIAINVCFCAICLILSLKAAKGGYLILNEKEFL